MLTNNNILYNKVDMIKHEERGFSYWELKKTNEPTYNLVFVHSFATTSDYFSDFAQKFEEKKYNSYLLDLPGFGRLNPPMYKPMSLGMLAEHVCSFIRYNNLTNVVLIGHSYGAIICQYVSFLLHDNNNRIIAKNILIDPANFIPFKRMFRLMRTELTDEVALLNLSKQMYYDQTKINQDIEFILMQCIYQEEISKNMKALKKNDLKFKTIRFARKLPSMLRQSTLVILGDNDQIIENKKTIHVFQKNPFVSIKKIEACGHIPFVEKPKETFDIIDEYLYPAKAKIEF